MMSQDPQATSTTSAAPTNSVTPLRLRFLGGQHDGQVVRVNSSKCTIGSAPNATLRLACAGVHPIHCLIMSGAGGTIIRSMAPDTLLNGETFEDATLSGGDTLSFGPLQLQVVEQASPAATPPATDDGASHVVDELNARVQTLESTNQQLIAKLEELSARYESEAQARAEELAARQAEDAAREAQSSDQNGAQAAELNLLREQLTQFESLNSEKQTLASQLASLQEHVQQAELTQSQRDAELQSAQEQLAEFAAMKESHDNLTREVVTLQKQMDQAEEYCTKWESQHQELESEFAAANLVNVEKDNELQALRAKLASFVDGSGNADQDQPAQQQFDSQENAAAAPTADEFPAADPAPFAPDPAAAIEPAAPVEAAPYEAAPVEAAPVEAPPFEAAPVEAAQPEPSVSHATQTMSMDDFNALSDAATAAPVAPAQSVTATVSETMIFEEGQSFDSSPQDSAMSMLDKLRAELGAPAGLPAEPETPQPAAEIAPAPEPPPATDPPAAAPISNPEEIVYAEPDSAAPVDTASILAKFGHAPEDLPADPMPTMETPQPEPVAAPAEDDDSIQDYMAQLMQRVGGTDESAPAAVKPQQKKSPVVKPNAQPSAKPATPSAAPKPAPSAKPLDPSEFVPRAVAPEASSGLKALRAVANTSTRSAIDRHQRRSLDSKAVLSGLVSLVAFAVCLAMGYLAFGNENLVSVTTLICLTSGFIGLLAAVKALAFSARSALGSRRQQNLKQLSAR